MKNGIFLLLAAAVRLTGCQSSQAAAKREQKLNSDGCISAVHLWSITFKHEMASFMGVSQERMPALFCHRLGEGIRSGRISYSDLNRLQLDQPTEIWLVIKGKSKAPPQAPAPRNSKFRTCKSFDGPFQIPASQTCPLSGYAQGSGVPMVIEGKPKATARAPVSSKFRNCSGIDGTFQVPLSQKCPLSGYAHY